MGEVLIGTAAAARRLGVSVATVNRWAATGVLPTAAKGDGRTGARMYRSSDVDALAERLEPRRRWADR